MATKKKAMGRGLDALFESNSVEQTGGVSVLSISDIEVNKNQPRKNFDEEAISELAESVKVHGVIQPIIVRSAGDGFYVIVAGERRYRAAKPSSQMTRSWLRSLCAPDLSAITNQLSPSTLPSSFHCVT